MTYKLGCDCNTSTENSQFDYGSSTQQENMFGATITVGLAYAQEANKCQTGPIRCSVDARIFIFAFIFFFFFDEAPSSSPRHCIERVLFQSAILWPSMCECVPDSVLQHQPTTLQLQPYAGPIRTMVKCIWRFPNGRITINLIPHKEPF